jgi:hypothetical protein
MTITDWLGVVGSLLLLIKIGIHMYIKRSVGKKFPLGSLGRYINPIFFLPITDDVVSLNFQKRIGNVSYVISLVFIVIFLIGNLLAGKK